MVRRPPKQIDDHGLGGTGRATFGRRRFSPTITYSELPRGFPTAKTRGDCGPALLPPAGLGRDDLAILRQRVAPCFDFARELFILSMSAALRDLPDADLEQPLARTRAYVLSGLTQCAEDDARLASFDEQALIRARRHPARKLEDQRERSEEFEA